MARDCAIWRVRCHVSKALWKPHVNGLTARVTACQLRFSAGCSCGALRSLMRRAVFDPHCSVVLCGAIFKGFRALARG